MSYKYARRRGAIRRRPSKAAAQLKTDLKAAGYSQEDMADYEARRAGATAPKPRRTDVRAIDYEAQKTRATSPKPQIPDVEKKEDATPPRHDNIKTPRVPESANVYHGPPIAEPIVKPFTIPGQATTGNEAPPLAGTPSKPDIESIIAPFITPGPAAKAAPVSPGKRYGTSSMRSKGSEIGAGVVPAEIMASKTASVSAVKPARIGTASDRRRRSWNRRRAALSQRFR